MTPPDSSSGPHGLLGAVAGAASRAAQQLGDRLPAAVADRLPGAVTSSGAPVQQTLTIAASAAQVLAPWTDPAVLSRLLGELGTVEATGGDGFRWSFGGGSSGPTWESALVRRYGGLRFEGGGSSLDVSTRPAPLDLGTETRLRAQLPIPSLAAGAAAFTLLYRLRALVQTGEIPTLRPQPAARDERG